MDEERHDGAGHGLGMGSLPNSVHVADAVRIVVVANLSSGVAMYTLLTSSQPDLGLVVLDHVWLTWTCAMRGPWLTGESRAKLTKSVVHDASLTRPKMEEEPTWEPMKAMWFISGLLESKPVPATVRYSA